MNENQHVKNIAQTFTDTALSQGTNIAVIEAAGGREVSFNDLNRSADAYANYFYQNGVRSSNRVILMVRPSADFIALTIGLFKLGATIILIDPGMGYQNLLKCIENVRPRVFVGIPQAFLFTTLFKKPFSTLKRKFCCGESFGLFGPDIRKAAVYDQPFDIYQPKTDDLAAIIFTTGSTGPPKGVRYEHSIFSAQLDHIKSYYKIGSDDVDQPAFPLFGLFATALGACAVIPDMNPTKPARVKPQKFIDSILHHNVSYSFGSPAIWNVVSRYCIENNLVLPTVKKVLMAGAPVPGELLRRMRKILPEDAEVFTPYGATESLPIVSIESREILDSTLEKSRAGAGTCVGRSLPGIDLKVIATSDTIIAAYSEDMDLRPFEIGEIIVRGDVVTKAYENNPKETEASKISDGDTFWHRMGDLGYLDDQDRLWFCGRKAHRVTTKDKVLYTIPCEAIFNEHEDVFRTALVGIPVENEDYLKPVLIIEPHKRFNGSDDDLILEIARLGAANDLTKDIKSFMIHWDFPVDIRHNAKIFREKLAVWAYKEQNRKKK